MSDYAPTSIAAAVPAEAPNPRKKRRVFMWFFLAVQALFLAWIIVGTHNATSGVETRYQGAADLGLVRPRRFPTTLRDVEIVAAAVCVERAEQAVRPNP